MKAVGVKNLKAHLSEHLRSVKAGETILVTEREEVIAELRPARGHLYAEGPHESALATLAETGELTRPMVPKQGWSWKVEGLGLEGLADALLEDTRADRC
jgi:antitoxin (DNA-binding transcriptional repressor) of toxin-antitoxin stability system